MAVRVALHPRLLEVEVDLFLVMVCEIGAEGRRLNVGFLIPATDAAAGREAPPPHRLRDVEVGGRGGVFYLLRVRLLCFWNRLQANRSHCLGLIRDKGPFLQCYPNLLAVPTFW